MLGTGRWAPGRGQEEWADLLQKTTREGRNKLLLSKIGVGRRGGTLARGAPMYSVGGRRTTQETEIALKII